MSNVAVCQLFLERVVQLLDHHTVTFSYCRPVSYPVYLKSLDHGTSRLGTDVDLRNDSSKG